MTGKEVEARERLKEAVTACRGLLERSITTRLERQYGIDPDGQVVNEDRLSHLTPEEHGLRLELVARLEYLRLAGFGNRGAALRVVREFALSHLLRLIALRMLEVRSLIQTAVGKGTQSETFLYWLEDRRTGMAPNGGCDTGRLYEVFLADLTVRLAPEAGMLFDPADPASRIFPEPDVLEQVLRRLNDPALAPVFARNRVLAWSYLSLKGDEGQTTAHGECGVLGNGGKPTFRDQFTPSRHRVECLVDNTLGRLWHEMRGGETVLANACTRMVRGPDEVFLGDEWITPEVRRYLAGEVAERPGLHAFAHAHRPFEWAGPPEAADRRQLLEDLETGSRRAEDLVPLSTRYLWETLFSVARADRFSDCWDDWKPTLEIIGEEVHQRLAACRAGKRAGPTLVPFRKMKDPRAIRVMDPACGSGRLLIYAFDLLLTIYHEAYAGSKSAWHDDHALRNEYPDRPAFEAALPGLILAHNLHGIDTDRHAVQIASFGLWLRAQRAYDELGVPKADRPPIPRMHVVVAESMPIEGYLFGEFVDGLEPPLLRGLVRDVFDAIRLAGAVESLSRIEESFRTAVETARCEWITRPRKEQLAFLRPEGGHGPKLEVNEVTSGAFFAEAKKRVLDALATYAARGSDETRRRLFVHDAVRVFEFVDLVMQDYDVVLTIPPSGAPLRGAVEDCIHRRIRSIGSH